MRFQQQLRPVRLTARIRRTTAARRPRAGSRLSVRSGDAHLVHLTSILRYPVFVDGANYTGAPSPTATLLLRNQLGKWFAEEMRALWNAVFVPLGAVADDAAETVAA